MLLDKLPPQNIEAEQMVLGSILIENKIIKKVDLSTQDFYKSAHQKIFTVMQELSDQKIEIDLITLTDKLQQKGQLEEVGGASYVSEIVNVIPTSANIKSHVDIVKEKAQRRILMQATLKVFNEIHDMEIDEIKTILLSSIKETRTNIKIIKPDEFAKQTYEYIEKIIHKKDHLIGVPSGFIDIDRLIGGWQSPELIIIASRPGMGKTSLKDNMAINAAKQGYPVGVFELEMGEYQTGIRHFSDLGNIPLNNLKYGNMTQYYQQLIRTTKESAELPIYRCYSTMTIEQISHCVEIMVEDYGIKLGVIDYLQLIKSSGVIKREEQISHISRSAKQIAKDNNIPIICLAQLNRSCEMREDKRPLLSDLRESGAIEQDADIVMFLYRDDYYKENLNKGKAECLFSKNRNGVIGIVELTWQPNFTKFRNLHREKQC